MSDLSFSESNMFGVIYGYDCRVSGYIYTDSFVFQLLVQYTSDSKMAVTPNHDLARTLIILCYQDASIMVNMVFQPKVLPTLYGQ